MTRDDITRMAREAEYGDAMADLSGPALERFALLVAEHERQAIIEQFTHWHRGEHQRHNYWQYAINYIAGRGQK
jgi:hypothetical protein